MQAPPTGRGSHTCRQGWPTLRVCAEAREPHCHPSLLRKLSLRACSATRTPPPCRLAFEAAVEYSSSANWATVVYYQQQDLVTHFIAPPFRFFYGACEMQRPFCQFETVSICSPCWPGIHLIVQAASSLWQSSRLNVLNE